MDYNDNLMPTPETFECMAKEYSRGLKEKGFVFIKLDNEDFSFLVEEVFDLLFKLRSSYRFLNGFMESNRFFELTEDHINLLRNLFQFSKNRAFQVRTNKTKCFLNSLALENRLIIKLNELSQKSDHFEDLSKIASERLIMGQEIYNIEGIFNNLTNLSSN